uniref:Uncharacterized protein n=1 Tax=Brassica campestris TaxID=3711 RepID=A0A3P5XZQ7_BRACM|nr:unnamed protein product [Brassica rapa]
MDACFSIPSLIILISYPRLKHEENKSESMPTSVGLMQEMMSSASNGILEVIENNKNCLIVVKHMTLGSNGGCFDLYIDSRRSIDIMRDVHAVK